MGTTGTTIQEIYDSANRRKYSDADSVAFGQAGKALQDAGMDFIHAGATHNLDVIDNYFQANRTVPVTPDNIISFVNANPTSFLWLSQAEREYRKVAAENPASTQALEAWYQNQTMLVKDDQDQRFENLSGLLQELRGRLVSPETINLAMHRIAAPASKFHTVRRQLHYIPAPRKVDPRQHQIDPSQKTGQFLDPKSVNKPPSVYRQEAREAYAVANPAGESASAIQSAAQARAEGRQGNFHSQTQQLQRLFIMKPGTTDIDWVQTDSVREQMQKRFSSRSIR